MTQREDFSDSLARWAFVLTMIGTALYAFSVYFFVIRGNAAAPAPADTVQTP